MAMVALGFLRASTDRSLQPLIWAASMDVHPLGRWLRGNLFRQADKTMSRLAAIISAIVICLVVCLGWLAMHYRNAAAEQKTRADGAEQQVNAAQAITSNVLTTMTIFNTIAEANQHAKEQIALDASGASADIRVAVANDDCTNRPVPAGAVKRLQQFANGLRQGAGGPVTGQPDG